MIHVLCAHCGGNVQVPRSTAGLRGKCPYCGNIVQIPTLSALACMVCGTDLSLLKRVKDSEGHYYCQPCNNAKLKIAAKKSAPATPA